MESSPVVDDPTTETAMAQGSTSDQLLAHWQGVYLLTLRITDDAHAAEDIVQEAYFRALQRVAKDRPANPRTWLFSIAANLARNWIRDRSTHRRLEKTMAHEHAAQHTPAQLDDTVLALRKHFKGLDEKYRTALSLHYEQGLTYREVAAVLHKPEGTAASLISRGVELLRQSLASDGHTIAPAIVAVELQKWGASAVARPELLATLKAALAAKSVAGAASAAAASKAGATLLTGKAVAVGGLVAAAALVFAIVHFTAQPAPAPVLAPIAPVTPVKGPAPQAAQRTSFDSELHFTIERIKPDWSFETIGETPAITEAGIAVPPNDAWVLHPARDLLNVKQVLAEVRASGAPGLNLIDWYKPLQPDEVAELVALPGLKTLYFQQEALNAGDIPKLAQLKSLEYLKISSAKLDDATVTALCTLPNLRVLSMHVPISDRAAAELVKVQKLEVLAAIVTPAAFARIAALPALSNLDISGSEVLDEHILANPALAPKNLKSLSLGLSTQKLQKLAQLRALLPHVKVNGWNPLAEEPPGQKSLDEDEKDALVALDRFAHDHTVKLPDADPEAVSVLDTRKISAEWVDTPVPQVLATLADHSEIHIVLDPAFPASNALGSVNLRISDMSCDLALQWVLRLANLSSQLIGHTVIVGSTEKFGRLAPPAPREYTLDVNPGEQPWTQGETDALAGVVNTWASEESRADAGVRELLYTIATGKPVLPPCRVLAAGKIEMGGSTPEAFQQFATDFSRIPPRVVVPRWIPSLLKRVDEPLTLPIPAKRPTLENAVQMLNKAVTGLNLVLDPKLAADGLNRVLAPVGWPGKIPSTQEAITALCNEARCTLSLRENALFISQCPSPVSLLYPVVLDLRPALKAGAPEAALTAALAELVKQGNGIAPVVIRGRWVAAADPVTARRVMAVLDEAAANGKVPALPPAPWYFELAKNAELQLPKPPKADDSYDGNGY